MTLKECIIKFMSGLSDGVATLKDIYKAVDDSDYTFHTKTTDASIRRTLYTNEDSFVRLCKGVYMLKGEKTSSLLIEGDGRKMEEIEDNSIDCIITDHPWSDSSTVGGNRHLATYDKFKYELSDFKEKARVLKPGSFMAEFLPVETSTNWEYLNKIKCFAKECGLNYYCQLLWKNQPTNSVPQGKTTKGVQQIVIFSKGKPRKLSRDGVNAYQTKEMLKYELEYFVPKKAKDRHHQAEKPIELYEYLISMLTEENEVCLDQFGGSCNIIQAAINTNRFAICYEIAKEFIEKAVNRFSLTTLYKENQLSISEKPVNCFTTDNNGQLSFA